MSILPPPSKSDSPPASQIDIDKNTDTAGATPQPGANVLHTVRQLLEQCNSKDHPEIVSQVKALLARSCHDQNAQHSLLLQLPPELIIMIGEHVLNSTRADFPYRKKLWFATVLPLMQTCTQLRARLRLLRLTTLTHWICAYRLSGLWEHVLREVKEWRSKSKEWHTGRVTFMIDVRPLPRESLKLSGAAALAGALECAIYGSLLDKPAVYVRCMCVHSWREPRPHVFYFGHSRESNVLGDPKQYRAKPGNLKLLDAAQGMAVWDRARGNGVA